MLTEHNLTECDRLGKFDFSHPNQHHRVRILGQSINFYSATTTLMPTASADRTPNPTRIRARRDSVSQFSYLGICPHRSYRRHISRWDWAPGGTHEDCIRTQADRNFHTFLRSQSSCKTKKESLNFIFQSVKNTELQVHNGQDISTQSYLFVNIQ